MKHTHPFPERLHAALGEPDDGPAPDVQRPRTRGECATGPRPCPWVGCRHHRYLDVDAAGRIRVCAPDVLPWEMAESCSLDVADRGEQEHEAVAAAMNCVRQTVQHLECSALAEAHPLMAAAMEEPLDTPIQRLRVERVERRNGDLLAVRSRCMEAAE